jgi:hypothetical protein
LLVITWRHYVATLGQLALTQITRVALV